ncbi:hypothetical protein [Nocardia carnea]|uniref:Uncharacterized protein n=1 Tax=Nocardia carnea TaxID=37328 RepID=A0ABW7TMA0_9NOCA|nr:hypothetical protein [Nocardia carnea]
MSGSEDFRPVGEVLAALDAVFAQVERPERIDACPCCLRPDKIEVLLNKPRTDLSADDLRQYVTVAMMGAGSAEDLRYFTPRILELCLTGEMDWPDIEWVYQRLRDAGWRAWPEAGAIAELMGALWAEVLSDYPDSYDPNELLWTFGNAGESVAANLQSWSRLRTPAAVHSLRDFVVDDVVSQDGRRVPNGLWHTDTAAHREVVQWLDGGEARLAVERAIAQETHQELLHMLNQCRDSLAPQPD